MRPFWTNPAYRSARPSTSSSQMAPTARLHSHTCVTGTARPPSRSIWASHAGRSVAGSLEPHNWGLAPIVRLRSRTEPVAHDVELFEAGADDVAVGRARTVGYLLARFREDLVAAELAAALDAGGQEAALGPFTAVIRRRARHAEVAGAVGDVERAG